MPSPLRTIPFYVLECQSCGTCSEPIRSIDLAVDTARDAGWDIDQDYGGGQIWHAICPKCNEPIQLPLTTPAKRRIMEPSQKCDTGATTSDFPTE